jgi:tetratricopeptide (TPR) repeat protein
MNMRSVLSRLLLPVLLLTPCAGAEEFPTYKTAHFKVYSTMPPQFVDYIKRNAEAYYDSMTPRYFRKGFPAPLAIYFLKTQADTQQLLKRYGVACVGYGQYLSLSPEPALFTHRTMDDGSLSLWGTLFHEITHHFIELNLPGAPAWFNEGLACMLGERTRIVKGQANIGHANPWRERALMTLIQQGLTIDVAQMVAWSDPAFYGRMERNHVVRPLFLWLHDTRKLDAYMTLVKERGYGLSVLEQATGMSASRINQALLTFIKARCYPAAYLRAADSASSADKEALLRQALAIQPDYYPARLELAQMYYYKLNDSAKARETVAPLLEATDAIEHGQALYLMGEAYYSAKDYRQARAFYEQALPYYEYEEHRHWLYYYLGIASFWGDGDKTASTAWFKKFMQTDWEPEKHPEWVAAAKAALAGQW